MRHAPPPASERQDAQPVTESLREMAGRVGRTVSAWLAMGLLAIGPAAALARVAEDSAMASYFLSGALFSVAGAWVVLRYRPGATERLWRFAVRATVVFIVILFLVPPAWRTGTITDGSPVTVLLAWVAGTVVAVSLTYRNGIRTLTRWLSGRGEP